MWYKQKYTWIDHTQRLQKNYIQIIIIDKHTTGGVENTYIS